MFTLRRLLPLCLMAFCLLVALVVYVGTTAMAGVEPAQVTADAFLKSLQTGDDAAAYQLCTTACKGVTSRQDLQDLWQLVLKRRGKVIDWKCENAGATMGTGGSSVSLIYQLHCEQGEAQSKFLLTPEGDRWLVQGYNVHFGASSEPQVAPKEAKPASMEVKVAPAPGTTIVNEFAK